TVQALVEQQVGVRRQVLPLGEGARWLSERRRLALIVQVLARAPTSGLAVVAEQALQLAEQIGLGAEVAEVLVAALQCTLHLLLHLGAVVAMKAVTFDEGGRDLLAPEYLLEGLAYRGGTGARRAGDSDDGMPGGHRITPQVAIGSQAHRRGE